MNGEEASETNLYELSTRTRTSHRACCRFAGIEGSPGRTGNSRVEGIVSGWIVRGCAKPNQYGENIAVRLNRQYRMNEDIAAWPNKHIYNGHLETAAENKHWQICPEQEP